jgi:DNA polymerase family A
MTKSRHEKVERNGITQSDPPHTKMILQVHDELIFEVPEKDLEEAKHLVKTEMEVTGKKLGLSVPLKVDLGTGHNWRVAPSIAEGEGQPGRPPARGIEEGMEPDDLLCSRNARSGTPLVGRAQWKINQLPKEISSKLGGSI